MNDKTTRNEFLLRAVLLLMAIFVVLSILVIGYLVSTIKEKQDDTAKNGSPVGRAILRATEDNKETLRILTDCTQPGGECYQQGQEQQAVVLGIIADQFVYAIRCSHEFPDGTVKQIKMCMDDLSKKS